VALRIIEERAVLLAKMAEDARRSGRRRTADQYEERTREYRAYADTLRQAATRDQR
jgi:two-component system chemotaxis response regulator CheB